MNKECEWTRELPLDMKQYFKVAHTLESDQMTVVSMYLLGDAKLWWKTRLEEEDAVEHSLISI